MKKCIAKGFGLKSDEVCERKTPESSLYSIFFRY